ncbi:hypothetical protein BN2156_00176 [Mycolicibacterium neworleansense]|uniref:Uncharacterized protein n=1 Tax=Mycolicibacterium neworleansense TaxID=146018 RepID=A0A0H5RHY2_9MYCO|nr:hypothetical protein BN2156_00176 [Mycolicibacterium neworleansense]
MRFSSSENPLSVRCPGLGVAGRPQLGSGGEREGVRFAYFEPPTARLIR